MAGDSLGRESQGWHPRQNTRPSRKRSTHRHVVVLKRIADQANATLPEAEHIQISPHVLRHTALRRAAEKHDVRYAMKLSGHTSSRYIWRYTAPSKEQEEKALNELF